MGKEATDSQRQPNCIYECSYLFILSTKYLLWMIVPTLNSPISVGGTRVEIIDTGRSNCLLRVEITWVQALFPLVFLETSDQHLA